MNKMEALKYLVENDVIYDEWSQAGMYSALEKVIESEKEELDKLLEEASTF